MAKTKVDYNDPKTLAILFQNLKNRFPKKVENKLANTALRTNIHTMGKIRGRR